MRDTIFISHATPEDNEFAIWLATKLELCGYKVWVDINNLEISADFWNIIERTIRDATIKFVFIASKSSLTSNRDGVKKELAVADRVRKNINNFIVPIRIDTVNFDDFPPELLRINAIDFNNNWANGFSLLLSYFEKQHVPKTMNSFDSEYIVQRWLKTKSNISNSIIRQEENYSSNLFYTVPPSYLYIYNTDEIISLLKEKKAVYKKIHDLIFTFFCPECLQKILNQKIDYEKIEVNNLLNLETYEKDIFGYKISNVKRICIEMINWSFTNYFKKMGLRKYSEDNRHSRTVFYFNMGVKSKRSDKSRYMVLAGNKGNNHWHYGLSAYFISYPTTAFIIRWHLVFTDSNYVLLPKASQATARRSKGRLFYNKQWRDLLETAIYYLLDNKEYIRIAPCCDNEIRISPKSFSFISSVGYIEPEMNSKGAQQ